MAEHPHPPTDDWLRKPAQALGGEHRWFVRLLGAVEATGHGQHLSRWPSRAVAGLLARLALSPDRSHPREELIELLWPGVPLEAGRNRLRQALSSLRGLLEPPGAQAQQVLHADRMNIRVVPGTLACDAVQFEKLIRQGRDAAARPLYRGELMPGFYEDWVIDERGRLAGLHEDLGPEIAAAPAEPRKHAAPEGSPNPDLPSPAHAAFEQAASTGLPSYWTRPFGVELSASRLSALLYTQRLVNLHGPGGSGKTRLAVEVAQALRAAAPWSLDGNGPPLRFDRIAFVPLIDCVDAAQVLDALCNALAATGSNGAFSRIVTQLQGRHVLLVLDNLEQLAEDAGLVIPQLLAALPNLHVLMTSRRLLGLDGEVAFELEGLALPDPKADPSDMANSAAVALFVDRARGARADFRLGTRHFEAVCSLVRLLGGMPLAIELAASRVRSVTPQNLLERLSENAGTPMLDLLARSGPRASVDQRHASMRLVVGWSWRQLSPSAQTLLQSLSILPAAARLDTVAAVAGLTLEAAQTELDELLDASLVQTLEDSQGQCRFALLQPVREFAAQRCPSAQASRARQALRRWLVTFARTHAHEAPRVITPEIALIHGALLTAPLDDLAAQADALTLALALRMYWESDNLPLSCVQAMEPLVLRCSSPGMQSELFELLSQARTVNGFVAEASAHADQAVALADTDTRRAMALVRWVISRYMAGQYQTNLDGALEEALALAQRSGDLATQAITLRFQAMMSVNLRLDLKRGEKLANQILVLWERLGNRSMINYALLNLSTMWAWQGRNEEAAVVMQECEARGRADADWVGAASAARQLGRVFLRLRRGAEAATAFQRSLGLAWEHQGGMAIAMAMLHLPEALVTCGQAEAAGRLQGFALTHWSRLFPALNRIEVREMRRARLLIHGALGSARAASLRAQGSGMGVAEAVQLALKTPPLP